MLLLHVSLSLLFFSFSVEMLVSGSPHYGSLIPRALIAIQCRTLAVAIRAHDLLVCLRCC